MNSNSHYTRPFGSGSIGCSLAIAKQRIPFIPVAYFVMGESTARWYSDAYAIHSDKVLLAHCLYTQMVGYKWLLLDYEGSSPEIGVELIQKIKQNDQINLMVINEFNPQTALQAMDAGVNTVITASDVYEEANNPVQLAREFYEELIAVEQQKTLVSFV